MKITHFWHLSVTRICYEDGGVKREKGVLDWGARDKWSWWGENCGICAKDKNVVYVSIKLEKFFFI